MRGGAPRRRAGGQRRGMPALPVHRGSCLCARVRYEVSGRLGTFDTCHCTDCRKSHAAAFAAYIMVAQRDFRFVRGAAHLTTHEAPTGTKRSFCRRCGSIVTCWNDDDQVDTWVTASTLDTPIAITPAYHTYVRSKASWYDLEDSRPRFETSRS